MWTFWILVCTVAGSVVAMVLLSAYRASREREAQWGALDEHGVELGLALLLKRGYDGAFAIFTDRASGRFVQFRKYIDESGTVGLEMHFPRAPWSETFYSGVQTVLRRHQVAFDRTTLNSIPTSAVIRVDLRGDVALASRIVSDIVLDVFQRPAVCLQMRADGICPLDETVNTSDHSRPTQILLGRGRNRHRRY